MQGVPASRSAGGVQVHLPSRLDAGRHVGEAEVHGLVLDQRLAHAFPLARVREGGFEGRARDPGGLRGDVDTARLEVGERDAIALALLAEEVLGLAVLEHDLRGIGGVLAGLSPRCARPCSPGVEVGTTKALMPSCPLPCRSRRTPREVRVLARGDELLRRRSGRSGCLAARRACVIARRPSRHAARSGRRRRCACLGQRLRNVLLLRVVAVAARIPATRLFTETMVAVAQSPAEISSQATASAV
jgi:hypothetical protein